MPELSKSLFAKHDPRVLAALRASTVGIAGAGGLGSNVAVSLARAGVGRLIIADHDRIEPSNLNRQQYFTRQIGRRKVGALRANLKAINPFSQYTVHDQRVTRANVGRIFGDADVLVEAFDKAATKKMLIEAWMALYPDRPIVAASGLAGYGRNGKLRTRQLGNLYVCGDEESECPRGISPMAPRVAVVANLQANLVVELLVERTGHRERGARVPASGRGAPSPAARGSRRPAAPNGRARPRRPQPPAATGPRSPAAGARPPGPRAGRAVPRSSAPAPEG
jgi:sulfur carrier protein ThiS adenylyltransferase